MIPMFHKGYATHIAYSDTDGCFVGHIAEIRDVIGFHGDSVDTVREAFHIAVDDYLDARAKLGRMPHPCDDDHAPPL